MTDTPSTPQRPTPVPDAASRPFFDATARGVLLIKRCPNCTRHLGPAMEACDLCHAEALDWVEASGEATLYTFTTVHQVLHSGFATEMPYTVIVVELAEGPRLNGNYRGEALLAVGMTLRVSFEAAGDVAVPVWLSASEGSDVLTE